LYEIKKQTTEEEKEIKKFEEGRAETGMESHLFT